MTIKKAIYVDSYKLDNCIRLEKISRKGNVKKVYNLLTIPGKYRTNDELNHKIVKAI